MMKNATMSNRMSGLARLAAVAGTNVCHAWIRAAGRRATMPMVMISEMPLPMPRSVIWSPSHMSSIVPGSQADDRDDLEAEALVAHEVQAHALAWSRDARQEVDSAAGFSNERRQQVTLDDAQHDGRVARVLGNLLPAAVLALHLAELGITEDSSCSMIDALM